MLQWNRQTYTTTQNLNTHMSGNEMWTSSGLRVYVVSYSTLGSLTYSSTYQKLLRAHCNFLSRGNSKTVHKIPGNGWANKKGITTSTLIVLVMDLVNLESYWYLWSLQGYGIKEQAERKSAHLFWYCPSSWSILLANSKSRSSHSRLSGKMVQQSYFLEWLRRQRIIMHGGEVSEEKTFR